MNHRPITVLASIEWFVPAYRAGGIISSLKNQVEHLKGDIDFRIVTGNADLTSTAPLSDEVNCWTMRDGHQVWHSTSTPDWTRLVDDVQPDLIYINGLFNGPFNRSLLRWTRNSGIPTRLASHGMLAPNALRIKPWRKWAWLTTQRILGSLNHVDWHATSATERHQIKRWFPAARVHVAQNLPPNLALSPSSPSNGIHFLSIGRVHPIKNYPFAAQCLTRLAEHTGKHIVYRVIGPIEDPAEKGRILNYSTDQLSCEVIGERSPNHLAAEFQRANALLVPSLTENYGQVIAEALANGVPSVVSDQTPWGRFPSSPALQCLPLDTTEWIKAMEPLMDLDRRANLIATAQEYFSEHMLDDSILHAHRQMLRP